jgi:hypothetical protein
VSYPVSFASTHTWHASKTNIDNSRKESRAQIACRTSPVATQPHHAESKVSISVHLADELVNVRLAITKVAALNIVLELACPPAASRVGKLEWPEEVGRLYNVAKSIPSPLLPINLIGTTHLLEVRACSENLMYEILDREDVVLLERTLDDGVIGEGDALLIDLAISALVNQLAHGFEVRLAVGDVGFYQAEHLLRRLRRLHEHAVVDLQETKELENFSWLWCNLVNTKLRRG